MHGCWRRETTSEVVDRKSVVAAARSQARRPLETLVFRTASVPAVYTHPNFSSSSLHISDFHQFLPRGIKAFLLVVRLIDKSHSF